MGFRAQGTSPQLVEDQRVQAHHIAFKVFVGKREGKLQLAVHKILQAQFTLGRRRARRGSGSHGTPLADQGRGLAHGLQKSGGFVVCGRTLPRPGSGLRLSDHC